VNDRVLHEQINGLEIVISHAVPLSDVKLNANCSEIIRLILPSQVKELDGMT
jgi:hypothetical protein